MHNIIESAREPRSDGPNAGQCLHELESARDAVKGIKKEIERFTKEGTVPYLDRVNDGNDRFSTSIVHVEAVPDSVLSHLNGELEVYTDYIKQLLARLEEIFLGE